MIKIIRNNLNQISISKLDYLIIIFFQLMFIICGLVFLGTSMLFLDNIVIFIISLIFGLSLFTIGFLCCYNYNTNKCLNLEDNKIIIRKKYLFRSKEEVYNNEDIIKAELNYKEIYNEGSYTHRYTLLIITKEEKKIEIFTIYNSEKIDDMKGLDDIVNYLNYYIKNKREMY